MAPSQTNANRLFKPTLAAALLAATVFLTETPAQAATVIGVEDPALGFVGDVLSMFPDYLQVGSDGEMAFRPFNLLEDASDAIFFGLMNEDAWRQAPDSAWTSNGNGVWYLPASNPGPDCPPENATDTSTCFEAVGHWISAVGPWGGPLVGDYVILSEDGTVGDIIRLYNTDGIANVSFASDPIGLPEPASLALLAAGLAGLCWPRQPRPEA